MRRMIVALALCGIAHVADAADITSVYTDISAEKNCSTYAAAEEGDGEWAELACDGYRGFPVLISYGDARESVFYGFPPNGEDARPWESFSGFNASGPKIEWRIEIRKGITVPFAAIHRWFVSDPEDSEKKTEVLVVNKVGQMADRDGCVVGLVVASGNPKANDMARKIADEQALDFACGADERVQVSGEVPLPPFTRAERQ